MGYREVGRPTGGQSLPVTGMIWAVLARMSEPLLLPPLGENDKASPQARWFVC